MQMDDILALAARVEALGGHRRLRFSVCQDRGWITTDSEQTIRTLCDLYNARSTVAASLRAIAEVME